MRFDRPATHELPGDFASASLIQARSASGMTGSSFTAGGAPVHEPIFDSCHLVIEGARNTRRIRKKAKVRVSQAGEVADLPEE